MRVSTRSNRHKLSNVRGFIILRSGEGLTSFNKDESTFLVNKYHEAFQGIYILRIRGKTVVKSCIGSRFRPRI